MGGTTAAADHLSLEKLLAEASRDPRPFTYTHKHRHTWLYNLVVARLKWLQGARGWTALQQMHHHRPPPPCSLPTSFLLLPGRI